MLKMIPLEGNEDVACFLVTKHSWKGKYKRIFSVGTMGITTYNPNSLEVTNKWPYSDISLMPSGKVSCQQNNEFTVMNLKKNDTMKFSSEHRAQLLTDALKCRFAVQKRKETLRYHAYKYHWSETKLPVMLEVTPFSLDQLDPTTCAVLASYYYKDFEGLAEVTDLPGGFAVVCGGFGRTHLFASPNYGEIRHKMQEAASTNVGISIKVLEVSVTRDEVVNQRFGKYSGDEHITSASEFTVQKVESSRHPEPQKRLLCLSETCLLERDHQTYSICTLRPLSDIFALVRSRDNPQLFTVEYVNGQTRTYTANDRDSLLASLLDGVRASNNRDVHVKMIPTSRGKRLGPLNIPVEDETESMHLKFLLQPPGRRTFAEIVERFNANVPYSGLRHSVSQDGIFAENKEKLISSALQSLIDNEGDQDVISLPELEGQFHALRRLAASKVGFAAFTTMQGFREKIGLKVVKALKREDEGVTHAAMDMICALMHPMHDDYDLRQEQLNKSSLLSSTKFLESLLEMWIGHVTHGTGALVVSAMLDYLTFALCVPYSETTDGKHFDTLLEMVADRGRSLFRLFQHPSLAVVKGAGLVMRAVIEEGEEEVAARMQDLALAEGALPRHLLIALFTAGTDGRLLTHRQLSRHLVGLWVTGHPTAMGLLKRIMPLGLLSYLDSKDEIPAEALEQERLNNRDNLKIAQEHANKNRRGPQWAAIERQFRVVEKHVEHALQHWAVRFGLERKEDKIKERPIVLRKRRERIKSEANWLLFYYKFGQDHTLPNLIWNHKTREELRDGLENELRIFNADRDLAGNALIAWNHNEFEIQYQCLSDEVRIGDYYLRLLLEKEDNPDSPIRRSYEFFNDLYHRFLLTSKPEMKCMCLQAMAIVYGRHFEDIGPFSDTKYILGMLDRCTDRMERDRLVLFINKLILHRRNVKDIMAANGVRILVDLLTLAHLHTSRAVVPTQSNVIEAGPNVVNESEKEWHYLSNSGDKKGAVSFQEMRDLWKKGELNAKTKCWAQGMDTWRTLQQIPQLKWCLMAKGAAVMNESDLATLILNILIQMCQYFPSRDADDAVIRPLPRVKRLLSESVCLPHVVQLLLTFDPVLVEKVATLLCEVMKDNPAISTLYLSGVFYFILMYTGSNVLPIARFLQLTHMNQAFRDSDTLASEIMQRSILGQLLPEAMVSYLENHGAEKFAQIYLGEFDTPEAIWNAEMRRMLIEKLCAHVADFSPRLRSNTRAIYSYCAIPVVRYPQLDEELFCSIFYLRHLCDQVRFPNWPINEPVKLLKDVLEAWKKEVEKKPPAMSVDDAYEALGLQRGVPHDEAASRKAYYRLAQQFHPDKNPEGREKFESVSKAYEFLCSRSIWTTQGPNPNNIVLILQTQSILFHRYTEELQPYKYAGYPQLIKTIQMETDDDQLFSKSAPLLSAASELAYHTVHCSALNAEELRRERGLDVLLDAYSRCVSVLSASSKPSDVAVQVCTHITRCFSVAAQFQGCRDKMVEMPTLVKDLCHILYFKHLTKLCSVATECVSSLAVDSILQMKLMQAGALWHLLLFMFSYDFTLEEGGVERNEEENQQEVANKLAKLAVTACARLGGYLSGELETPSNAVTRSALERLLTPYLSRQLGLDKPAEILKTLNSNCENPYLLWDNGTRAELCEFLEEHRQSRLDMDEEDPTYGSDFTYSMHEKELIVGEIFVRIYNEQPTFPIENSKGFTIDLLEFLAAQSNHLSGLGSVALSESDKKRVEQVIMTLEALSNVIKNNPGVEMQCIGHFRLLFGLLGVDSCKAVQQGALNVVSSVTRNQECVNDIAASDVLVHLLLVLYALVESQATTLETLYALMSTTKLVKEALNKGAVIYLLDLFCNSNVSIVREKCAELLARMMADKLMGPKVRLTLGRFLPPAFADAMRDSPQACVHMFENTHENPELIWDTDCRKRVCSTIAELREEHHVAQRQNPKVNWRLPEDSSIVTSANPNELVVAGVYLRLFVDNPGWVLRKPKEFLAELLDTCFNLMSKEKPDVELLELATNALVSLLQAQPALADQVPSLGHIPRICKQMVAQLQQTAVPRAAILILHQLATSEACISAMAHTDCICPLKKAMQVRKDMIGVACETLHRLFSTNQDQLVRQALDADMVPYLLGLLDGRLDASENPAMTKAQIVKALKSMTRSLMFGEKVTHILDKSSVWTEYKDQRHDLFISNTPMAGYLTGAPPATAGYLTQGPSPNLPDLPPPMDREDPLGRVDTI